MATEPIQSGPYPVPADPPDGPNQMSAIVTWTAGRLNMRFASEAARDAAIPAPTVGMECTIGSGASQVKYIHNGAEWVPVLSGGSLVAARRWPGAPFAMASGAVDVPCAAGVGEVTVTLPAGRFASTPRVLVLLPPAADVWHA